jgi:hypothetical protein
MIIYFSGITQNTCLKEIDRFKPHFMELGCTIFLPEDKSFDQLSWAEKLQNHLGFLSNSNAIYKLPNWRDSIMARIELTAAMSNKLPTCFSLEDIIKLITTLDG